MISRVLLGILVLIILCSFLSIPFIYVSQTLWYKVGTDKYLLWTGQFTGLLTLVLLLFQVILSTRGKFLEDVYGLASLMKWHRINGVMLAIFAFFHVILVLAPEGIDNLPIGKKYWPEMTGAVLLWIIAAMAVSSHFRERLKLDYKSWRRIHKPLGYTCLILLPIHVVFVSDSFEQTVPRVLLGLFYVIVIIRVITVKMWSARSK